MDSRKKKVTRAVFVDLTGTYDRVNHHRLLTKILKMTKEPSAYQVFWGVMLTNWQFFIEFNNNNKEVSTAPSRFRTSNRWSTGLRFIALIQFKYNTLTHCIRSPDGVGVSILGYNAEGIDIGSHRTRFQK